MAKVAVVYWSGTGNTEKMAGAVAEGAKGAGADVDLFEVDSFSVDQIDNFDALALGCPSMGAEELEEGSYEPFFAAAVDSGKLSGKPVVLFGSWGWGRGTWSGPGGAWSWLVSQSHPFFRNVSWSCRSAHSLAWARRLFSAAAAVFSAWTSDTRSFRADDIFVQSVDPALELVSKTSA